MLINNVTSEIEIKTHRIATVLKREGLGAVLLNGQHNFSWLTGGASNGIDLTRENGAASLLVTSEGKRYIFANNIEMPRMLAEEVSPRDFEPVEFSWQAEKANGNTALDLAKKLVSGDVATDIPMFAGTNAIEGKIAGCRYELTEDELARYRDLGRDAGAAIGNIIKKIAPGQSELEIAAALRNELALSGMSSAVTLVAADERISRFRHPVPTENTWRKVLLMVTCAKRFGLIVSLSRIVCVGSVPEDLRQKTEENAYVHAAMLDATRVGEIGAAVYAAAAKAYADRGFPGEIDLHHQGGPTGYRTREWVAHPACGETVRVNQAFAWNPTITGTKVEETFLVTENGVEVVTATPDFPLIETVVNGHKYFSPGILSLWEQTE